MSADDRLRTAAAPCRCPPCCARGSRRSRPSVLEIPDDSADHVGHAGAAGGGGHFSLTDRVRSVLRACRGSRGISAVLDARSPTSMPHPDARACDQAR